MTSHGSGEHALIAGGASGIGAQVAIGLQRRGIAVSVVDRDLRDRAAFRDSPHSDEIRGFTADVCDADLVRQVFRDAEAAGGTVTRLVVSVGGPGQLRSAAELDVHDFQRLFDTHVTGTLLLAREFITALRTEGSKRHGALVTLGSTTGVTASRGQGDYGSVKAAVGQLTRVLAMEWAAEGVRANTVAAGQTRTPFVQKMIDAGYDTTPTVARTPLGRLAEVDEIAAAVEFLLLDATYVTGVVLPVDGGWTALGR